MLDSRTKKRLIGAVSAALFAILLYLICSSGFGTRWRALKPGMTQMEVGEALGPPTSTGYGDALGAGKQFVTRWYYKRGRSTYYVDFDYIGDMGMPVVFRTDRYWEKWKWPSWWPARAKAK
jgi:hypothetical protein